MKVNINVKGSGTVKFRGSFLFFKWDKTVPFGVDESETIVLSARDFIKALPIPGPVDLLVKASIQDEPAVTVMLVADGTSFPMYQQSFGLKDLGKRGMEIPIKLENVRGVTCSLKLKVALASPAI